MCFKIPRRLIAFAALIFYICTPMLDSMVCADCVGNVPFLGVTTISHMKTLHSDVNYPGKGCSKSNTPTEQGKNNLCSICANSALAVDVYPPQIHILVTQSAVTSIEKPLSELHYSIHKPPPNSFV